MNSLFSSIRNSYEKNWPEIHAACTGSLARFIYQRNPEFPDSDVPVFCYHSLEPEQLERDLEFLTRNNYVTIDAHTFIDHLRAIKPAPDRSVVLTIDDGAKDMYDVGLPLLRKYGMKATAFVAARFHLDSSETTAKSSKRLCTWDELRTLHESGCIDIQSHSYEHRYIPRWPEPVPVTGADPAEVEQLRGNVGSVYDDFRLAKETIESKIGNQVEHLAFVKYQGSDDAIEMGLRCGYKSFWWGYLPHHSGNCPGQDTGRITRIDAIYLLRLPGSGRRKLANILAERYGSRLARICRGLLHKR